MKTKLLSLLCYLHKTQPDLMKVPINSTSLCFDLANYLYAELDFDVLMINNGLDEGCGVDAYHMYTKTAHHMHTYTLRIMCVRTAYYTHQIHVYHMHATVDFCISIAWFSVCIWHTIYMHLHETRPQNMNLWKHWRHANAYYVVSLWVCVQAYSATTGLACLIQHV